MKTQVFTCLLSSTVALIAGCSNVSDAEDRTISTLASLESAKYRLTEEPEETVGVIEARETANDGAPMVVVGRIGGTTNPFVEGRAAFMMLDASIVMVAEGTESAEGELCTGDCCATERAHATMLVKFLNANGRVLAIDSRHLLGVAENEMVVVRGTASKDNDGNVALIADGVFIRE